MPISPAKTRSCSTRSSGRAACSASASSASQRPATPSVRSASPASASFDLQNLRAARRRQRPPSVADHFEGASRQQHVGRSLGEHDAARSCSVSRWMVLISLRSEENGTSPTRGSRLSSASELRPALRAATSSAPSVGIALHGPPAVALLHRGVVRPIGDGERALELDPQSARRSVPPPSARTLAFGRVARARRT